MNLSISSLNGELVTILINNHKGDNETKSPFFVSLRWILMITYLTVGMLPVFFITNNINRSMEEYFVNERKAELLSNANMIAGQVSSYNYLKSSSYHSDVEGIILQLGEKEKFRILVLDASGLIVYDTGYESQGQTLLIKEVVEALGGKSVANQKEDDIIYVAVSVFGNSDVAEGVVFIADDITNITNTVNDISNKSQSLQLSVILIVILTTFLLTKIFTEPIKNMIQIIQKMSKGHFEQRVDLQLPVHNEIIDLAYACNDMVEQLDEVESSRQQFVLNVSHELKTPLSSMKVLSESILIQDCSDTGMYREFLGDINSEVDRMTDIINDLLALVKLDQKEIPIVFKEANLHLMLEGIIKRLTPLANVKNIKIKYSNEKDIFAQIDEMKMILAISNIIDNAIKYTPDGGKINILLNADHQNAFINIIDTGIGIPENEISRIFDRFYRVDKTRDRETGGTGLGLSITHSTILMHNGSVRVTSKEDEGTNILVRIPLKKV